MKLIFSERDAKDETVLAGNVYDDRETRKRVIRKLNAKPRTDRRILGSVKKVCGGAFFGHNMHFAEGEQTVIDGLVKAKSIFKLKRESAGWVAFARSNLHKVARPVIEAIRDTFGGQVDVYLKHFAKILADKDNRLDWDVRDNNCQAFATNLLQGLAIHGTFHGMPKAFPNDEHVRNANDWSIPRYSMCFGSHIDTPLALLRPQPRSLIWNFYHKHRNNCDLIEFGEAYRRKPCAFPTSAWQLLDGYENTEVSEVSLVNALWTIPRDSISVLHTHLLRDSSKYSSLKQKLLTREQWVQNRLRVLHQLDIFASLSGALSAALMEQRIEKRQIIAKSKHPLAEDYGDLHVGESYKTVDAYGISFTLLSGRERNWHKQEWKHLIKKLVARRIVQEMENASPVS
jgi:hypothetical protein